MKTDIATPATATSPAQNRVRPARRWAGAPGSPGLGQAERAETDRQQEPPDRRHDDQRHDVTRGLEGIEPEVLARPTSARCSPVAPTCWALGWCWGSRAGWPARPAAPAFRLRSADGPRKLEAHQRGPLVTLVVAVLAALGAAISFAPSWDSYTLRTAAGAANRQRPSGLRPGRARAVRDRDRALRRGRA